MYGCRWSESLNLQNVFDQALGSEVQKTIKKLMPEYPCRLVFIWDKNSFILLQFCSISTLKYIEFLKEYNYSSEIINFINNNEDYNEQNISHDIGFSIDKINGKINRTAIYGII